MSRPPVPPADSDLAITIAPGVHLPLLGLGVWELVEGDEGERAIVSALAAGYRHIDTAQGYGNEATVGKAVRASGIPREQLFVTTKFYPGREDSELEAERSVELLGLGYIDLYLVHDPRRDPVWAWPGMQRALARGLTRSIGVSNFSPDDLDALLAVAEVPPAVNQLQLNPFAHRRALVAACEQRGIAVEAYSPLTRGTDLADPVIAGIAQRLGRTPAQVMLRWGLEHGFVVLPKSNHAARQQENAAVFDFSLGAAEMAELDALDRTGGSAQAHERPWW
jgi:diketogulonate reductase-like aldo/keto reductase